jgi:MFS transporter, NNP family, nitrate/nitrite transporter
VALGIYLAFYATCLALTWWFYLGKGFRSSSAASLAEARV